MRLPRLGDLPSWEGAARVSLDTETRDPQLKTLGCGARRDGYIVGISFAIDRNADGYAREGFYLPVRHAGGGNYPDPSQVFAWLRHQAQRFRGDIVGANLQYDLDYLANEKVEFRPHRFRDVQIAGALLLQPELTFKDGKLSERVVPLNLNALAERAGLPGKDESALRAWAEQRGLNPKADLWQAHASVVAPYAIQDAMLSLRLIHRQLREIAAQNLSLIHI